jgi:hypothetical protein
LALHFKNLFVSRKLTPMANMNFRGSYPFDESTSTYPAAGGLPGLLQEAMRQQSLQSALLAPDDPSQAPQPSMAPEPRVLPTWLRQDQLIQPLSSNSIDNLGSPRDSNFRQLVSRPQSVAPPSDGDQAPSTAPPHDRLATIFNLPRSWLGRPPTDDAQTNSGTQESVPAGAVCIPKPGQGSSSGTPWPLPADDEDESSKLLRDLWISFAKRASKSRDTSKDIIDQSYCAKRERREIARCSRRAKDTTHKDFYAACEERARDRRLKCDANDGYPDPDEKPQWGNKDEEIWLNLHR